MVNFIVGSDVSADTLNGTGSGDNNRIFGNGGNDSIIGGNLGDQIFGGEGNDTVQGGNLSDAIGGDNGNDSLMGGSGADQIYGGEGQDTILGNAGDDFITGDNGNDSVDAGAGEDVVYGGIGNDSLLGGDDADLLSGAEGDDSLLGGAGNDVLYGIHDNNTLDGGAGQDRFVIAPGDDNVIDSASEKTDTIFNFELGTVSTGGPRVDVIDIRQFGFTSFGQIQPLMTRVDVNGNPDLAGPDTRLDFTNPFDRVLIIKGVTPDQLFAEHFRFFGDNVAPVAVGDTYNVAVDSLNVLPSVLGNDTDANNDILQAGLSTGPSHALLFQFNPDGSFTYQPTAGYTGVDSFTYIANDGDLFSNLVTVTINVGVVNQTINGDENPNTLTGGNGNDTINGNGGNDSLTGGTGGDLLIGGPGDDTLDGADGNDTIQGNAGNDRLIGGVGADSMDGGADSDTLYYAGDTAGVNVNLLANTASGGDAQGDLFANIENITGGSGNDSLTGDTGANILTGNAGADTLTGNDGNDTLAGGAGADSMTGGQGSDTADYSTDTSGVIVDLFSGLGSSGDAAGDSLFTIENVTGGSGNDALSGDGNQNVLTGNGGNDSLMGGIGDDSIAGGAGADVIEGNPGADILDGGADNDTIRGGTENDTITGASGNDSIAGEAGDDSIDGGAGDDSIDGGLGDDTYVFTGAFGNDTITETALSDTDVLTIDGLTLTGSPVATGPNSYTLTIGAQVFELTWAGPSTDLTIRKAGDASNSVTVTAFNGGFGLDFTDGVVDGTTGADDIAFGYTDTEGDSVSNGADSIAAAGGNDTIDGAEGSDTIDGGAGDDLLTGAQGADQFIFTGTFGNDTVTLLEDADSGIVIDGVTVAGTATATAPGVYSLTVGAQDFDLFWNGVVGSDLTIRKSGDVSNSVTVQNFDGFGGGISTPTGDGTVDGTASGDLINGSYIDAQGDSVTGGADVVLGDDGDDTIFGLGGNDTLRGGAGNDGIDGADGADSLIGGENNDTLTGGIGDDTLDGGVQNDVLNGGAGNDNFIFSGPYGNDTVTTLEDTDGGIIIDGVTVAGTAVAAGVGFYTITIGADVFELTWNGVSGSDLTIRKQGDAANSVTVQNFDGTGGGIITPVPDGTVDGTAVADLINGAYVDAQGDSVTSGNDIILAGSGNDTVIALGGNDTITGGGGNDQLDGGTGNDTFLFASTFGNDTITGLDDTDGGIVIDGDVIAGTATRTGVGTYELIVGANSYTLLWNGVSGSDLTIRRTGDLGNSITVQNFDGNGGGIITPVADGTVNGTAAADNIILGFTDAEGDSVTGGNDSIEAAGGNDTVNGDAGSDTIDGGAGDDLLTGGAGNDNFLFNGAYGNDTITSLEDTDNGIAIDGTVVSGTAIATGAGTYSLTVGANVFELAWNGTIGADLTIRKQGDAANSVTVQNFDGFGGGINIPTGDGTVNGTATAELIDAAFLDAQGDRVTIGADSIQGGAGNDTIFALAGNDSVDAGDGNDSVEASDGNDILLGGAGNDTILGGAGDDTFLSSEGDDSLIGGTGNDRFEFSGTFGDDTISALENLDTGIFIDSNAITGTAQKVGATTYMLTVGAGTYLLDWDGPGTDLTIRRQGDAANSVTVTAFDGTGGGLTLLESDGTVNGTASNDSITLGTYADLQGDMVTILNDSIVAAGGNDTVNGDAGNDTVDGGQGADSLFGGVGNDFVFGGLGGSNDTLLGNEGSDTLDGGAGNDSLSGGLDADRFNFTGMYGHDTITDVELFGDAIYIDGNAVTGYGVAIGGGQYTLSSGGQSYTLSWNPSASQDLTIRRAGDPANSVTVQNFTGNAGGIQLNAPNGIVDGTDVADFIGSTYIDNQGDSVGNTNDLIVAGAGNDTIYGLAGNDTLIGEEGNDLLDGGVGFDQYIFFGTFGNDTITSLADTQIIVIDGETVSGTMVATGPGLYQLGGFEIAWSGVSGSDMVIRKTGDSNNSVTVKNFDGTGGGFFPVATAPDGTVNGTASADSMVGGYFDLQGDSVTSGSDLILGDVGNDTVHGLAGNDTIDGGAGDDLIDGGAGNDRFAFGGGYGNDTLVSFEAGDRIVIDGIVLTGTPMRTGVNTYNLSAGGQAFELTWSGVGTDLVIRKAGDAANSVTVKEYDGMSGGFTTIAGNGTVDGTSFSDIIGSSYVDGDGDSISGTNDVVYANGGNDIVTPLGGNDLVLAGTGNDSVDGGTGNDTLIGEAGNDTLLGNSQNDMLDGGAGNDSLDGGTGSDQFVFVGAFGNDTIASLEDFDVLSIDGSNLTGTAVQTGVGTYTLGAFELTWAGGTSDLVIRRTGDAANSITVKNYDGDSGGITIPTGDGTVDGTASADVIDGSFVDAQGDSVTAGNDSILGNGGNDTVTALSGNDTIDGGTGNDQLTGGTGNDTFLFSGTYGNDTVTGLDNTDGGIVIDGVTVAGTPVSTGATTYTITVGADVFDLTWSGTPGTDLVIRKAGDAVNSVTVNDFDGSGGGIVISTADGTVDGTSAGDLIDSAFTDAEGDKVTTGDDSILGNGGNDTIIALAGADIIDGGQGQDSLDGGADADTFLFNGTFGDDTIASLEDGDTGIVIDGTTIAGTAVVASANSYTITVGAEVFSLVWDGAGNDLTIRKAGDAANSVTVEDFDGSGGGIIIPSTNGTVNGTAGDDTINSSYVDLEGDHVTAGADFVLAEAGNDSVIAGDGNDTIYGGVGNDILSGGNDNDSILGEAGNDRIFVDAGNDTATGGDGNDTMYGWDGNDTLAGDAGDDYMTGDAGTDSLSGGAGIDTLWGGADNDTLDGGADDDFIGGDGGNDIVTGNTGNDTLFGYSGNDTLTGGTGNDYLFGGDGADRFVFTADGTTDSLYDFVSGADIIQLQGYSGTFETLVQPNLVQDGYNAVLTLDTMVIKLVGVNSSALTASDFVIG